MFEGQGQKKGGHQLNAVGHQHAEKVIHFESGLGQEVLGSDAQWCSGSVHVQMYTLPVSSFFKLFNET